MLARKSARSLAAVAAAVLLHALLVLLIGALVTDGGERGAVDEGEELSALGVGDGLSAVELVAGERAGELTPSVEAAGDAPGLGAGHPYPMAAIDSPGQQASTSGAGFQGPNSATGRHDIDIHSAEVWTGEDDRRLFRERSADLAATSPEALTRAPRRRYQTEDREARRARDGEDATRDPSPLEVAKKPWRDADPLFSSPDTVARVSGAQATRSGVMAEVGARATESHRRGRARDSLDSAAASPDTDPSAFERGRPSSGGGVGVGAGARSGQGVASSRRGPGSAASRARAAVGPGATRATRSDPYFREMYRKVERILRFPEREKRELLQGEVILLMALRSSGEVASLSVHGQSGRVAFDREAVRAFAAAAPFDRVPDRLLGKSGMLHVLVPLRFKNPLIR